MQFNGFQDCYGQSPTCQSVHGDGDDGEIHAHMDQGKSFNWDDEPYSKSSTYPICQYTTWLMTIINELKKMLILALEP